VQKRVYFPLISTSPRRHRALTLLQNIDGIQDLFNIRLNIDYEIFDLIEQSDLLFNKNYILKCVNILLDNYKNNKDLLDNINLNNLEKDFIKNIYNKFSNKLDYDYIFLSISDSFLFFHIFIIILLNRFNFDIKIIIGNILINNITIIELLDNFNNIFIRFGDLENVIIELINNKLEESKSKLEYFNYDIYQDYMPIYNQHSLSLIKKYSNLDNINDIFLNFTSNLSGKKIKYLLKYYKKNNFNYLVFLNNILINKSNFIKYFNTDLKLMFYTDFTSINHQDIFDKFKLLNIDDIIIYENKIIDHEIIINILDNLNNIKEITCIFDLKNLDLDKEFDFLKFIINKYKDKNKIIFEYLNLDYNNKYNNFLKKLKIFNLSNFYNFKFIY
jgi:hypothetical protein